MITVSRTDDTQADFQEGVLTDVEADAGGFLRIADAPVLDFDGVGDYVDCGNDTSLDITDAITIEAWVKPRRFVTNGTVCTKRAAYYLQVHSDGTVACYTYWDNSGSPGISHYTHSNSAIPLDAWTHIAFVEKTDGTREIYINGILDKTDTAEAGIWVNSKRLWIGAEDSGIRYFDGNITEVRLWNVARTQAEIQADMNKRLTGNETGLVAYYPLNEGAGTTVTDNAGTNNGTIYGATWVQNELLYFMNPDKNNNRVSPQIDLSKAVTVKGTSISWTETLNGQTINIETRVSFDGGLTWTPWSTCVNGGSIPNLTPSTQVVNALLECRQNLSTTDPAYSPQLETLNITVEGIGMTLFQSFNF